MEFNFERRLTYNFLMVWLGGIAGIAAIVIWIFLSKFFGNFIEGFFGPVWGWIAFFGVLIAIPATLTLAFFLTVSDKEVHEAKEKKKAFGEGV